MTIRIKNGGTYENVQIFTTSDVKPNMYIFTYIGSDDIHYIPSEEFDYVIN